MRRQIPVIVATGLLGAGLVASQVSADEDRSPRRATNEPSAAGRDVDQAALVPPLLPEWDWSCRTVADAPVCKGTFTHDPRWGDSDASGLCDVPIYTSVVGRRSSTRYYGDDQRLARKIGRVKEVERFSTSEDGPAGLELRVSVRYVTEYDVAGDESTGTQVTKGRQWDMRDADGRILFRTVGTLVEPYDGPATFTGTVNVEGTLTRVVDAPLEEVLDDSWFFDQMCEVPKAHAS